MQRSRAIIAIDCDPYLQLAAAILRRARLDLRSCRRSRRYYAWRFWRSDWCGFLLDGCGIDRGWALKACGVRAGARAIRVRRAGEPERGNPGVLLNAIDSPSCSGSPFCEEM